MKKVDIISNIVARKGEALATPSKDISKVNLSGYLLKSIWDKVWEIRTDSQGAEYIFGKLPVVTQYGITMYSGDGVDVPSLASGLPFDGRTIWYNPETNQIEVIGGTGGGSGEGVSNFWDLSGIPSWITNSKPKYSYSEIQGTPDLSVYALKTQIPSLSGYATESWVTKQNYATKATTLSGYGITDAYTKTNVDDLLKAYVTLTGTQTIAGEKNFTGGLKVNGSPIVYDTEKKYWKLEGDLLVTGGVTMYGSDSSFTPSTIMDAIAVDGTTISKSGGVLKVIGGTGGGVADSVAWGNITGKPTWIGSSKPTYSYSEITGAISTTELQNYLTSNSYLNVTSGDNRYLKLSGGTIDSSIFSGLSINSNDSSINRSSIVFLYDDSNKSQFGWDGYSGWGTFMYNYPSSSYLGIKDNGTLIFNGNTILHSGNIGSYNAGSATQVMIKYSYNQDVNYPLVFTSRDNIGVAKNGPMYIDFSGRPTYNPKSDTLTVGNLLGNASSANVLATSYSENINYGTYHSALKLIYNVQNDNYGFPNLYVSGLSVMAGYTGWQLMSYGGDVENPYFRSLQDTGAWKPWRQIAFLTDNVASATRLQTARTIWGQSFDGSSNVDGDFTQTKGGSYGGPYGGQNFYIYNKVTSDVPERYGVLRWAFDDYAAFRRLDIISKDFDVTNTIISFLNNGNVGIGTTNPSAKLEIESSNFYGLYINSKDSSVDRSAMVFKKDGVNKAQFGWDALSSMGVFMYSYPSSFYLGIKDDGSLVFGKYSINFSVDSSGNGLFYGGVTMYSQRSLKNVVDERGLSLNELSTIKPTRYTWKDGRDNKLHIGGIADDIQQVLPEVVYTTSDGILTMDYGNAAFAVASSLIQPVVDHEKRIVMLQKRIVELEEEVERLKCA